MTAKRLDSDEVVETTTEVDPSATEGEVVALLGKLVRASYPDAEFRSFADGAATFLAPKLMVVAVHRVGARAEVPTADEDGSQQQLFAA